MHVSVETLQGLERKMTLSIPAAEIEEKVQLRLRDLMHKVKIDGFRPGKVPMTVIKNRFANNVRKEVISEMLPTVLQTAITQENLDMAFTPTLELGSMQERQDFSFTASFEVLPQIQLVELTADNELELVEAYVNDADVDAAVEQLRKKNQEWREVDRKVVHGDKLTLEYKIYLDNEQTEHTHQENIAVIVGSKEMLPEIEEGLIGAIKEQQFDLNLAFPEHYHIADLAGKHGRFNIIIHQIFEGILPLLNDEFVKKFDIKEGGVAALKQDLKVQMIHELNKAVNQLNKDHVFEKFAAVNVIELPKVLIEHEIKQLQHEFYHQIFGHNHNDGEKIPDFPRELFASRAEYRVSLGLLFKQYIKQHNIAVDNKRVDALLDSLA